MMEKWCLHASLFMFDWIIIKVAGNQERHKSSVEFDFGLNQTTHFGVTWPWVTKISHFWTWISLKPVGQSWSNFICSIIGVGERLRKVLGQIDIGTLDSGERSLPFGLLVFQMMTLGWPWTFQWQGPICFLMRLYGWQLIQHWVLVNFQVCSNSVYHQHSGTRYRANGPLVYSSQRHYVVFLFPVNPIYCQYH